ncbi:unnamed protein product, partial [Iphiclides podalirius]
MIPTRSGKKFLLMIDGYTYSQINYSAHWLCSSKAQGCTARVRRTPDGKILQVNTTHIHPPPKYVFRDGTFFKFIPTEKGKYILVLRGFTYSQVGGRFFYCSSKHMGCRARVRLLGGKLVASGDEHNHAPPSHARCGNGAFVQLRPPNSPLPLPILPLSIASPRAASLALHALNFPRIMPKTDLWHRLPAADAKKDP